MKQSKRQDKKSTLCKSIFFGKELLHDFKKLCQLVCIKIVLVVLIVAMS